MKLKRTIALLTALLLFAMSCAQGASWQDHYAAEVIRETNAERARYGLGMLRVDAGLTAAARVRAMEIAEKFSHTRPDGSRWKTVSEAAWAENIARGQKTPDKAIAAWMTSDGHRTNILRASYGSIGVACIKVGNIYHWVQIFGK